MFVLFAVRFVLFAVSKKRVKTINNVRATSFSALLRLHEKDKLRNWTLQNIGSICYAEVHRSHQTIVIRKCFDHYSSRPMVTYKIVVLNQHNIPDLKVSSLNVPLLALL